MKNFYKILDNGKADIRLSVNPIDGYTEFEVGAEPNDLENALLSSIENSKQIAEAKAYLISTDFKMTVDYDKDTTEVKVLRQKARDLIRSLESNNA